MPPRGWAMTRRSKRGNADLETENKKFYGEPKDNSKDENKDAEAQIKAAAGVADASIKTKQAQVSEEERLNQISTQGRDQAARRACRAGTPDQPSPHSGHASGGCEQGR